MVRRSHRAEAWDVGHQLARPPRLVRSLAVTLLVLEAVGRGPSIWSQLDARPRWQRWTAYYVFAVTFIGLALTAPAHTPTPFIYFQF